MVYIPGILSHADYDEKGMAKMMIGVPEKYALEVSSPTPIASEQQHEQYLSVLDKLASKEHPTIEEEVCRNLDDPNRSLRRRAIIPFPMLLRSKSFGR